MTALPAILVVWPHGPLAQTSATPPIRIPPAQLPVPGTASSPATMVGPARIEPAPQALLPTGWQILRDQNGSGLTIYGALNGKVASAASGVLAAVANAEGFDPAAAIQLLASDETGRRAQALFIATMRGAPVIGIAVATLDDRSGNITVLYDKAETFAASFSRMQQLVAKTDSVEIGRTDNSVCDCQASAAAIPNLGWEPVIRAIAGAEGEVHLDPALTQPVIDGMSADTGTSWRMVPPAAWK